jgi:hypothetical protein
MDDGVESLHSEFIGKIVKQYDFTQHIADGNPKNGWSFLNSCYY